MRINLISSVDENWTLEKIVSPNQVYAWFLHMAFENQGVDARFVKHTKLKQEHPPKTDHTIVISSAALTFMAREAGYAKRLRSSTEGKLTCYFNTDELRLGDHWFSHCFTQIAPRIGRPKKYICVGWGVDPTYSYPDQDEKAAFLDSRVLLPKSRKRIMEMIYEKYDAVLSTLDMKIYNPVPLYYGSKRIPYQDYQATLRKCHYYLCTQFGEGGISRLEAAACGALIVVPSKLYRKKTMNLLNHQIWRTEEDLRDILDEDVDIEANRQRTLEHTWSNVAKKILAVLKS